MKTSWSWWTWQTCSIILKCGQTTTQTYMQTHRQQHQPYNALSIYGINIKSMNGVNEQYKLPKRQRIYWQSSERTLHIPLIMMENPKIDAWPQQNIFDFEASDRKQIFLTHARSFVSPASTHETSCFLWHRWLMRCVIFFTTHWLILKNIFYKCAMAIKIAMSRHKLGDVGGCIELFNLAYAQTLAFDNSEFWFWQQLT